MADLNVTREKNSGVVPPSITRDAPREDVKYGTPGMDHRRRHYQYDRVEGIKNQLPIKGSVTMLDRLSDEEYARRAHELDQEFGMVGLSESVMAAYHDMLYITYALIGGSQVAPNSRGTFVVGGVERNWSAVAKHWGVDLRRAYRTVADDVNSAVLNLLKNKDVGNADQHFLREQVLLLADMRGLSRFPHLVADCADAAYNLTAEERAAVVRSKQSIISSTYNAVDRRNLAVPVQSAEAYDSTNHEVMADSVKAGRPSYRS